MRFHFQNKLRRRSQRLLGIAMDPLHIEAVVQCHVYGLDDALLIGGTVASLAGTGASIAANQEQQSALNQQRSLETQRQMDLQNQANQVFNKTVSTSSPNTAQQQINAGAAQRQSVTDALKQIAAPVAGAPLPTDQNSNPIVSDDATANAENQASMRGNAWSNLASQAAAKEGGYEDWQTQQGLNLAQGNRQIGVIGAKARGWESIFPLEMDVASHAGDALQGWGQLASALGSAASMGGAMGVGRTATPMLSASNAGGWTSGAVNDLGPAVYGEDPYAAENYNLFASPWSTVGMMDN